MSSDEVLLQQRLNLSPGISTSLIGVHFGQRRPPLSVTIKGILERYPDGQIFKVMLVRISFRHIKDHKCVRGLKSGRYMNASGLYDCQSSLQAAIHLSSEVEFVCFLAFP